MSTLATNAITDASGGNTATINGQTPTESNMAGRNRIINGGMGIWQRGTSGFTTLGSYSSDRWFVNAGTSLSAVSRSTDVPAGFQFSTSVAGTNVPQLVQRVESLNCFDLAGQDVTVSFWAKQTSGAGSNSLFLQLLHPNATDNYAGVTQIGSNQLFTGTSGWVQYSATFSNIPAGAANGLQVIIGANTAGAATFLITGVQLEKGSTATSFDYRPYGTELQLCQRYFARVKGNGSNSYSYGTGIQPTPTTGVVYTKYPCTMRSTPTITGSGIQLTDYTGFATNATIATTGAGFDSAQIELSMSSNGASLRPIAGYVPSTGYLDFASEL